MNALGGALSFASTVALVSADDASRAWFTAAELADLALPGLPADKRSLNRRARDERWQLRFDAAGEPLARKRAARGGGIEFHVSLLPGSARLALIERGLVAAKPAPVEVESASVAAWRWFEGQTEKTKAEATRRAAIIAEIELLEEAGMTRTNAAAEAHRRHSVATSTIWNWFALVEGVPRADRLPALAPRRKGGGAEAEMPDDLWRIFISDWLRPEAPTLTSCYARTAAIAATQGIKLPNERSIRRKIEREIDPRIILQCRGGRDALNRSIPDNRRTLEGLHAMQLVNVDGHQFDVFVKTEDGRVIRPVLLAIQDVYSRKMLAWKLDESENYLATRLAFLDLFKNYGIPAECLLDNSRTFAGKQLTGGARTRYRYKVRADEAAGLLTSLGIKIRFATIYHGQSKPIERTFRDLADTIARSPECAGAYTGNKITAKPSNHGSRAVEWDEFVRIVDRGIALHNARLGRKAGVCAGRSFDQTFAESYAVAPIGKATPDQLRIAMLTAEQVRCDSRTGEIKLYGNRYWSPECGRLHGQRVTVRFDPADLMREIHIYALDGRYLTAAPLIADTGFLDVAGANAVKKRRAEYRRLIREGAEAEQLLAAHEIAAMQADIIEAPIAAPSVIRPVRHRGTVAALKVAEAPAHVERESKVFAALGKLRSVE